MSLRQLLLDEPPLLIFPSLAAEIGLNEGIFLQQLHYWLQKSTNEIDGYKWVYNTLDQWLSNFPFWSKSTLRRTISSLEKSGLVLCNEYNQMKIDKTKWYTINYEQLVSRPCVQNEQTMCSKWTDEAVKMSSPSVQNEHIHVSKMNTPITRDYTEITSETTSETTSDNKNLSASTEIEGAASFVRVKKEMYEEIINYLNEKAGTKWKATGKATQELIKGRIKDGFDVNDFKTVIDIKVTQWINDGQMSKYLRPQTLFGNKFEGYLNEKKDTVVLSDGKHYRFNEQPSYGKEDEDLPF